MCISDWLTIASVCLLGAASPGPSLIIVLRNTQVESRAQGYLCAASHGFAVLLYALAAVFGLSLLLTQADLYKLLTWASCFFLGWVGMQLVINKPNKLPILGESGREQSLLDASIQGFAVAFLNPKLAVFFFAIFIQFLHPALETTHKLLLAATAGLVDFSWYCLVVFLATGPLAIKTTKNIGPIIDRTLGLVLIVLAISIIWR